MNHFQFPVSFGTVLMFWNDEGFLSQIQLKTDILSKKQSTQVPNKVSYLVERLQRFFIFGEPLGEIPWENLHQYPWTEFQKKVYQIVSQIPHGETRTYSWVAHQLGKRSASRAVGQALKKNPFPVIIPCHRVVGAKSLGGFLGEQDLRNQSLSLKQKLVGLEEEYLNPVFSFLPQVMIRSDLEELSLFESVR